MQFHFAIPVFLHDDVSLLIKSKKKPNTKSDSISTALLLNIICIFNQIFYKKQQIVLVDLLFTKVVI